MAKSVRVTYGKSTFKKMGQVLFSSLLWFQIVLSVLIAFISVYFGFMAFSLYTKGIRWFMIAMIVIWAGLPLIKSMTFDKNRNVSGYRIASFRSLPKRYWIPVLCGGALLVIFILLSFFSTPIFISNQYRNLISVTEQGVVQEKIEDFSVMKIPIVDKALAIKLGDKKLGEDNLGSQFDIRDYTMIEYNGDIYWVGAIEYSGFFKWINQRATGTPGFIMVSATDPSDVQIVKTKLRYVPSAFFGERLQRKVYFSHMDKYIDYSRINFELDAEGNPKYVFNVMKKQFVLSNGKDIAGVIVLDPVTGASQYYDVGTQPGWIDRVQSTEVVAQQLDYWGNYVHGFFNSLFAKKEVMHVTEGYNYIYTNGKFYYYSGMTSYGSDESIVGVVLVDLKSKEATFCKTGGVTEYAAQQSAEGLVQDLQYKASFPILVNFNGVPTYFMTLKDNEGLIKKYAFVSLADYTKSAIGDTVLQAQVNYSKLMSPQEDQKITLTIRDIVPVVNDGTTYYYVRFDEASYPAVYQAHILTYDYLPFLQSGDQVQVVISGTTILSIELAQVS